MKKVMFVIFILLVNLTFQKTVALSPESFFEKARSIQRNESSYNNIVENFKSLFEIYAFLDIAQSPPQPSFYSKYFNKHDFYDELDKVSHDNMYDFYRGITLAIANFRDGHTSISFDNKNDTLYQFLTSTGFFCPFEFLTEIDNSGIPQAYARVNSFLKNATIEKYVKNGKEVIKKINENKDIKVKSVNGKDPFDFMAWVGEKYNPFHNHHAIYVKSKDWYKYSTMIYNPLEEEDVYNITLIYENGEEFKTDLFLFMVVSNNQSNNLVKLENELEPFFLKKMKLKISFLNIILSKWKQI